MSAMWSAFLDLAAWMGPGWAALLAAGVALLIGAGVNGLWLLVTK